MNSNLSQLFRYARDTADEAKENFTTEALAAAIRHDPAPVVVAFRGAGLLSWDDDVSAGSAQTQIHVPGAGVVDLAVTMSTLAGRRLDIWVEIKVAAGESGRQLDAYADFASQLPESIRPRLAVVSKRPLRKHPAFAWVPWQSLWRAIEPDVTGSPYWHDLKLYLEEIGMAGDRDAPFTPAEALSLGALAGLRAKAHSMLWELAQRGAARWPEQRWPKSEIELSNDLNQQLRVHNRLMFYLSSGSRAYPIVGIWRGRDEALLAVWVESTPKRTDIRRRVLEAADGGGLPTAWVRSTTTWLALVAEHRLVQFESQDEAVNWALDRLGELDAAGLLSLLPTLGLTGAGSDDRAEAS